MSSEDPHFDSPLLLEHVLRMGTTERELAYRQVAKTTELFLEWRHKVMAFTFAVTAALLAVAGWAFDHDLRRAIAAPLLLGAIVALASAIFDSRNQQILYGCYELADALEQHLGFPNGMGPLARIRVAPGSLWRELRTYHRALYFVYRALFLLLLGLAVYAAVAAPKPPQGPSGGQRVTHNRGTAATFAGR